MSRSPRQEGFGLREMSSKKISLIAAVARNGVIGNGKELPWRLPIDMKHFMDTTENSICVMGRGNWESIPLKWRPLKNRTNIVMTTQESYITEGAHVFHSVDDVLSFWKTSKSPNDKELFIIGGSDIYSLFLQHCDKMYVTHIDHSFEGDVFFPNVDYSNWNETSRNRHPADERHESGFDIVVYERNTCNESNSE